MDDSNDLFSRLEKSTPTPSRSSSRPADPIVATGTSPTARDGPARSDPVPGGGRSSGPSGRKPTNIRRSRQPSSLTDALNELGAAYEAAGHPRPVFNYAASSVLARQIDQGAGADLFISADEPWMDYLAERPPSGRSLIMY